MTGARPDGPGRRAEEGRHPDDSATTVQRSGRDRLVASMRPRLTRAQVLAAALCAVLGFALVTQVRQTQAGTMESLRQGELIALLENVTARSQRLDDQATELERQLAELRSGSGRSQAAEAAARRQLADYAVLAGTVAVRGPGVEITIADPVGGVTAAALLDAVQELRGAGAEAIQIGSVRVVVDTAFVDTDPSTTSGAAAGIGPGITVGGTPLQPPYRVLAIGEAASLARALNIPGGVVEALTARQAVVDVQQRATITIDSLHTPRQPVLAQPVAPSPVATP